MSFRAQTTDPHRVFRAAIMNGVEPPMEVIATLEARGVNIGDLERRVRESFGVKG
jgi:hypothetical protein